MIALGRWLLSSPAREICWREERVQGSAEFIADVAALANELQRRPAGRWILATESAYACAVSLLALWQCEKIAVMPPNLEAGSLRELARGAQGVLTDRELPELGLESVAIFGLPAATAPAWRPLEPQRTLLELCTSGSTGARKVVSKTLDQMESEIEALEREFGAGQPDARVIGTVSFQHIYGLLFRVLWPLCAGRIFADESIVDPARIATALEKSGPGFLISSPAHLKRLPELLDLSRLRGKCVAIFSSGGALDRATACCFETHLGFSPTEVLGSTETGGIAWRRQSARVEQEPWLPFPGARVEARDGLLHVRSRPAGAQGATTGDAIEILADGRFLLLGRADRIVKLFDERVSLVELESRLCAHELVKSCAALTLERNGTMRMAAAVVLSAAGEQRLREHGKSAVIETLQAHLRAFFRATVLPRTWRFVERLPEDAQGKSSVEALEALFTDSNVAPRSAKLVERAIEAQDELELELEVPRDLVFLRGHFDEVPVVAGVVQLQWVIEWAAEWLGAMPRVHGVEALKFKQMLLAGDRFRLRLERTRDAKLRFKLWNERGEFSSGRVLLEQGAL